MLNGSPCLEQPSTMFFSSRTCQFDTHQGQFRLFHHLPSLFNDDNTFTIFFWYLLCQKRIFECVFNDLTGLLISCFDYI